MSRTGSKHSSRAFETELRELRAQLLAMGARCERVVAMAFDAFLRGAPEVAEDVAALDAQIDRDEIEIYALILRILALRQPVADDLRFLTTALRLITDLERIGDEAVNITERAAHSDGDAKELAREGLSTMAVATLDMLHAALDAFVKWDDRSASFVLGCDDAVDHRHAAILASMTAYMSDRRDEIVPGLCVIRVAKYLERIADHATNVAEEVIFMVRGDDVRHGQWQAARTSAPDGETHIATNGSGRA